ncbi:hypothetical protein ABZ079_32790 [Streptomyces sp. NPDC006314]|uniref:hypothetical protein n=1 Tax=Streptomyces sp. NPDC006314 TaxID=3154475 RepID=UPI0033B588E9
MGEAAAQRRGNSNESQIKDPKIDKLFDDATATTGPGTRAKPLHDEDVASTASGGQRAGTGRNTAGGPTGH